MKTLKILLITLGLVSCLSNEVDIYNNCDCNVEIKEWRMDYNIKPYTGVIVTIITTENSNITDCSRNDEVLWSDGYKDGGIIATIKCR